MDNLRENIRRGLLRTRRSQASLARAIGIQPSHLSDYLNGRKDLSTAKLNLDAIAEALGLDVPSLFRPITIGITTTMSGQTRPETGYHEALHGLIRELSEGEAKCLLSEVISRIEHREKTGSF